jgi:hypothetical protein
MARKKSINQLVNQLSRTIHVKGIKAYSAYIRAFEFRFGFMPHSNDCKLFIETYGKDYLI